MLTGRVQVGERVWVTDANGYRIAGAIASIAEDFLNAGGFVVLLDGEKKVVTCCMERRGRQWDFATD